MRARVGKWSAELFEKRHDTSDDQYPRVDILVNRPTAVFGSHKLPANDDNSSIDETERQILDIFTRWSTAACAASSSWALMNTEYAILWISINYCTCNVENVQD